MSGIMAMLQGPMLVTTPPRNTRISASSETCWITEKSQFISAPQRALAQVRPELVRLHQADVLPRLSLAVEDHHGRDVPQSQLLHERAVGVLVHVYVHQCHLAGKLGVDLVHHLHHVDAGLAARGMHEDEGRLALRQGLVKLICRQSSAQHAGDGRSRGVLGLEQRDAGDGDRHAGNAKQHGYPVEPTGWLAVLRYSAVSPFSRRPLRW